MQIRAVFFDLDDTLCDFKPAWDAALGFTFRSYVSSHPGVSLTQLSSAWNDEWAQLVVELDAGRVNMAGARGRRFAETLSRLGRGDPAQAATMELLLGQRLLHDLKLFEDVEILVELRPQFKTAIVTNGADDSEPDSQRTKATRLGLLRLVDLLVTSDACGSRKPDSRIFHAACDALNVSPAEVVFVGDSIDNDVFGANCVGMTSVLLQRTPGAPPMREDLREPRHVIHSLRALPAILRAVMPQR